VKNSDDSRVFRLLTSFRNGLANRFQLRFRASKKVSVFAIARKHGFASIPVNARATMHTDSIGAFVCELTPIGAIRKRSEIR